jgi:hypothetical protein
MIIIFYITGDKIFKAPMKGVIMAGRDDNG